jgi:uncharacterized protein YjbI with pentapeptide repeats
MKIAQPRLSAHLATMSFADFEREEELENALVGNEEAIQRVISGAQLESVLFEKIQLTASHFERMAARDTVFKHCDLSSTVVGNGALNRVLFDNCRMIGVDFNKTALHDVVFRGCKLDMANFRFADLRRIQFVDCTLAETDFLGAVMNDIAFESCVLQKTIFDQVKCKQVDLRTSQLDDISGWASMKGMIIDDAQLMSVAGYLARELGIAVK